MASGLLIDYLGSGPISSRPATPTLFTGSLGLWYATDTDTLSAWDGSSWSDVGGGGGGTDLGWFNILDYRDSGDPDDSNAFQLALEAVAAARGGAVYFPPQQGTGTDGKYDIGRALQDTGGANAQIVLPSIDILTGDQITIELRGAFPPTPDIGVIGDIPVSVSGSVIESTLTSGSGGSLIGIKGPSGSAGDFSNVLVVIRDLTIRMPDNPTHSAIDLRYAACAELDNVVIDTGSYYVQGLPEPTTSGSYALRMPRQNNGALCRLGTVNVIGFYNGYEFAEHSNGFACQAAWGCKRAFVFNTAPYHGSHFQRLMAVHCEQVVVGVSDHFLQVEQLNIEHASSGWWVTDHDVYDPSNYLVGYIGAWQVVLAGSGVSNVFTVSGASRLTIRQLGVADDAIAGLIAEPADKDYRLVVKAPHRGRIVETTTISGSGTCTATFKINTTALGGTANSVSTSEQSQAHSSSNVFAAGDDIALTVSGNSSCVDLSFCIRYQRL